MLYNRFDFKSLLMLIPQYVLDARTKLSIQKVANAIENAFAGWAILVDENLLLFEQKNEKTTHTSIEATIVSTAKVLSYEASLRHSKSVT